MIRTENIHRDAGLHAAAIAKWENEGGAVGRRDREKAASWCVPPIVVPAFLIALIVARAAYLAYS
jgi:hypothetical protein